MLDASVLLAAQDPQDPEHGPAQRVLEHRRVATIDLAGYETVNTAIGRWQDPEAGRWLQAVIWAIEDRGDLLRIDRALLARAGALAEAHGITSYDAAYVAAAEHLGAPLVSCDVRDLVSRGLARLPSDALA